MIRGNSDAVCILAVVVVISRNGIHAGIGDGDKCLCRVHIDLSTSSGPHELGAGDCAVCRKGQCGVIASEYRIIIYTQYKIAVIRRYNNRITIKALVVVIGFNYIRSRLIGVHQGKRIKAKYRAIHGAPIIMQARKVGGGVDRGQGVSALQ